MTLTDMFRVQPMSTPAMVSGEGSQPFSAQWCSSTLTTEKPCSSHHFAMSMAAR